MPDSPSFDAAARARRPAYEPPPAGRRRPHLLLVGLPIFAVFAAFGAIVWLAYQHGADVPPVGEPPVIKAPATALKLSPDEAGSLASAEGGEVRDLLTDTPPGDQVERLLPRPEEPLAPIVAAPASDPETDSAPAPTPEAPVATAAVDPPAPAPTPEAPAETAAVEPPAEPAPAPAEPAPPAVEPAPPPAEAAAPPPQIAAATPAEPTPEAPLAVERQSPPAAESNGASAAPQPSPEEAEAALDALLAEVTQSAAAPSPPSSAPSPPPAPEVARPAPTAPVQPPPEVPGVRLPAPEPTTVSPFTPPGGEVTAIARERPSARPSSPGPVAALPSGPVTNGSLGAVDGDFRIQLAAVRDEADARRAWDLFLVDLGSVLSGVQPFIERAETANGVFYRVQIGPFASQPQAETLCDELKRRNASCFVIRR